MAKVTFANEAELQTHIDGIISEIRTQHAAEIAALNELLIKAREANATADYSAFEAHPDLVELMKKTDLRPGALPALCALQVWNGKATAKDISAEIKTTPKLGDKGGVDATPKIISSALQKLEKALLSANTGVGIKVTSIRGKEGNSTVKRIKFRPMEELTEDAPEAGPDVSADEQQAA